MAGFNQNVKINIDLEAKTKNALTKISGALGTIRAQAGTLGKDLQTVEDEVKSFGESFGKDDDIQIGGEVDHDSIEGALLDATQFTSAQIKVISQSGVTDIKIGGKMDFDSTDAVANLAEEVAIMEEAVEEGDVWSETKQKVTDKNKAMARSAKNSVTELNREESSFASMIDAGDSLTTVKQKVADANKHVQAMSKESARELGFEDERSRNLLRSMGVLEEGLDETGDTMSATSRQLRKMRRSTNRATDSMRAAAEVGDLFEDGLGSLSVNMGAFTIALRNFLTQVPLLLTGLGAAGSAALGAAAGFLALAGAMGAVVGVGALAHAQQLKEEYAGIEELGQSMQVIMLNLRDVFFEALEPLTNSEATIDLFVKAITGLARAVNVVSKEIAGLTEGTDEFAKRMEAGAEPIYTVQDAFSDWNDKVIPAFLDLAGSITVAFEEIGAEMVAGTAQATAGLANMIDFSVWLFDQIEDLNDLMSQFGDTMAELSILGARIGGGLIPVFQAFSTIVESVASALNEIESQTMQDAITFLVMMAAINKLSGVMGSLLTIMPNLIVGMANISTQARAASGAIGTMRAATAAAGAQLGGFLRQTAMLGGMTNLVESLFGTGEQMRRVAFNSAIASEAFDEMAEDTDHASDELRELAIQGMFTNEVLEDLGSDVDYDITPDRQLDAKQFLPDDPITGSIFGGLSGAAEEAGESSRHSLRNELTGEFATGSDSPFKKFADDDDALDTVKAKMAGVKTSFTDTTDSIRSSMPTWTGLKKSMRGLADTAIQSLMGAYSTLVGVKKSVLLNTKALMMMTWRERAATLSSAAAKFLGATANIALAAASYIASSGILSLAASVAIATGGIAILAAAIGGLAVGIIANFGKIKKAAADSFGFLKEIMGIIVDVLITYFLTSWNLMVEAFQAVVQGLQPLTNMFMDLAETLGLVGGKGDDGASMMAKLGSAGDILKGTIKALGAVFGGIIDILGGVLWVVSTVIKLALTPLMVAIEGIMFALDLLSSFWDMILEDLLGVQGGVSGLIDMLMNLFDAFMNIMSAIPRLVESAINSVINIINGVLKHVPGVSTLDEVDFTDDSELQADREDLAEGTRQMQEGTAEKSDKTITYNEDNSTNIDQTVNADPEDQAQLSRVVTDAIAEANSFERRRQGGQ